ncbi:MAG: hypothetical protein IKZ33_04845 [Lentisphaeria bacterium]|nr:hypothetical protein [Lentisphaeria bacterium]
MLPVILGTDWWTDCDDVMALRLLCRFHNQNKLQIRGICLNGCMEHSVRSVGAFLHAHGLDGIPLALDRSASDFGGNPPYQARLAAMPSPRYQSNADAEEPVSFYRRLLSETKEKITLLEIGYPQVLAALLHSEADAISPLNGVELVRQKVAHLWIMAGKWDEQGGRENNFARNRRASVGGAALCRLFPVPVTFLGYEVGYNVISGGKLPENDPVRLALKDHGSFNGRASWDPMLIVLAASGDPASEGYRTVSGFASADPETGLNYFREDPAGPHRYVIKTEENSFYSSRIDSMLSDSYNIPVS